MTDPSNNLIEFNSPIKVNVDLPYDGSAVKKLPNGGDLVQLNSTCKILYSVSFYFVDGPCRYWQ